VSLRTHPSLANDLELAFSTEAIVAWRSWSLSGRKDGRELLLRPVAGRARPWRPREPTRAVCKHARAHAAPNVDCTCGLHGVPDPDELRRARHPSILGRAAFWGRVIEHDRGFRAEFAYPQRLALVCRFCFWQWGSHAAAPDVVGWFPRDELIPLCWMHLDAAARVGLLPRRLLSAEEIDERLRRTYLVDPLPR
jgi:hypothetical protein